MEIYLYYSDKYINTHSVQTCTIHKSTAKWDVIIMLWNYVSQCLNQKVVSWMNHLCEVMSSYVWARKFKGEEYERGKKIMRTSLASFSEATGLQLKSLISQITNSVWVRISSRLICYFFHRFEPLTLQHFLLVYFLNP